MGVIHRCEACMKGNLGTVLKVAKKVYPKGVEVKLCGFARTPLTKIPFGNRRRLNFFIARKLGVVKTGCKVAVSAGIMGAKAAVNSVLPGVGGAAGVVAKCYSEDMTNYCRE